MQTDRSAGYQEAWGAMRGGHYLGFQKEIFNCADVTRTWRINQNQAIITVYSPHMDRTQGAW